MKKLTFFLALAFTMLFACNKKESGSENSYQDMLLLEASLSNYTGSVILLGTINSDTFLNSPMLGNFEWHFDTTAYKGDQVTLCAIFHNVEPGGYLNLRINYENMDRSTSEGPFCWGSGGGTVTVCTNAQLP